MAKLYAVYHQQHNHFNPSLFPFQDSECHMAMVDDLRKQAEEAKVRMAKLLIESKSDIIVC